MFSNTSRTTNKPWVIKPQHALSMEIKY